MRTRSARRRPDVWADVGDGDPRGGAHLLTAVVLTLVPAVLSGAMLVLILITAGTVVWVLGPLVVATVALSMAAAIRAWRRASFLQTRIAAGLVVAIDVGWFVVGGRLLWDFV